jgi:hypothetical protein
VVELERILLVISNVRHGSVIRVSKECTVLRMLPMRTMMVQKPGITHCCRLIWSICPVWPVRTKRALVVGHGGSQVALTRYPHDSAVWMSIHLVWQERLQRWYLVQHGIDLGEVLPRSARARLKVEAWAPIRRCILPGRIGRSERKVLLDATWHIGVGCYWQKDMLGCMWLFCMFDRGTVVCGGQYAIWRLPSQHMLWWFR